MNPEIIKRYQSVKQRIADACHKAGRPIEDIQLLAVSKTKPIEDIQKLAEYGHRAFGENYVQEAIEKISIEPNLEWHFIGPIQSNKTKHIANNFAWVHSVDRLKIAQRLNDQRSAEKEPLNILLEVNISGEQSKAGLTVDELFEVAPLVAQMPNLQLRGLMAIPQPAKEFEAQCQPFAKIKALQEELQGKLTNCNLDTLSMGMSADLEAAIMEGATIVRIGTDIFGTRQYSNL